MTTSATSRDADRRDAVRYSEAEMHLRSFARHYRALMAEVIVAPELHTFGPTAAAHLRNVYDDLGSYFTLAAEQAAELAAEARSYLAGDVA